VNIRWNKIEHRFEAEFSSDFVGDLDAVKTAGFKPDTSSGAWVWWTAKTPVLNKLRNKKPASGLTINPDALDAYRPLAEIELKNDEVKRQLAEFKKKAKKEQKQAVADLSTTPVPEGKTWISKEDLPPAPPYVSQIKVVPFPATGICEGCGDRTYFYELPDLCLWCELKKVLDNPFGI
jgi:hypothetical protein